MKRDWSLKTLNETYAKPAPPWALLDDEYGDFPSEPWPQPINPRVDWLRVAVLGLVAAVLLLAGRFGGR